MRFISSQNAAADDGMRIWSWYAAVAPLVGIRCSRSREEMEKGGESWQGPKFFLQVSGCLVYLSRTVDIEVEQVGT